MSKLYRITKNPELLSLDVQTPESQYYSEHILIKDPDGKNPLMSNFLTLESAQYALEHYKKNLMWI